MKHECLKNEPDRTEGEGPFEIRPEWPGQDDDDDDWEVARPSTRYGRSVGVFPGAICVCPDRAHAEAVRDALNAYVSRHVGQVA
ncbi:hypothetical protein ACVDG3_18220 [Meridianimarinicoccus sp. RP-17]|uniref:hypothetical protein n=1 Tax=Meridianimarinicoccus zhengii TaxID=2056810 RepID=UPI0013A6A90D|nr:hypothetical protein [Phycocomes zhengii]